MPEDKRRYRSALVLGVECDLEARREMGKRDVVKEFVQTKKIGQLSKTLPDSTNDVRVPRLARNHFRELSQRNLNQLLDVGQTQQLMACFCNVVGISATLVDLTGQVLVGIRRQRICEDFHQINARTCERCLARNAALASQIGRTQQSSTYHCPNGLMEATCPILIDGQHVANVFVGQFLSAPPDLAFFRQQALEYGFDETAYLKSLGEVPIISDRKLSGILDFVTHCTSVMAQMGFDRLRSQFAEVVASRRVAQLDRVVQKMHGQKKAAIRLAQEAEEARKATERSEQALRDSEEKLRTILNVSPLPIAWANKDGHVEYCNRKAVELFKYAPHEVSTVEQCLLRLCPDEHYRRHVIGRWKRMVDRVKRAGTDIGAFELEVRCGDDSIRFIEVFATLLGESTLVIATDLTDRKQADRQRRENTASLRAANLQLEMQWEQLRAQQQDLLVINAELEKAKHVAESANRAKGEFLANMSHEIRTPMTAILGFADVLVEPAIDMEQRQEAIRTIRRNGEHLLEIINDILDISKIESGRMTVESIPCSPVSVIAEVVSSIRVRADAKKLPLCIQYVGAIPETIHTDPTRLRQILINLLANAIKFTETGSVTLEVQLAEADGQSLLQFDVIDTGIGMTAEQVQHLFHYFTQADSSTTRQFGGAGLGLVISKRLAEMLGGTVSVVESQLNRGTRIRVRISAGSQANVRMIADPLSEMTIIREKSVPSTNSVEKPLQDCSILLAEDGPDNQKLICRLLDKAGARVTVAANGQLAAEAALDASQQNNPFAIILMDMQMPVLDGYQATRLLREKGYHRPIVALTAHAMPTDREKCLAAGCDEYLTKPINRAKLIEVVGTLAGRSLV